MTRVSAKKAKKKAQQKSYVVTKFVSKATGDIDHCLVGFIRIGPTAYGNNLHLHSFISIAQSYDHRNLLIINVVWELHFCYLLKLIKVKCKY